MYLNLYIIVGCLLVVSLFCIAASTKKTTLKIGTKAPDFTLPDEIGTERSMHEFKGKKVVLYFYPKDDTPGCTKEACELRNIFDEYKKHNIIILGINYDSPTSHANFKAKHNLPFTLLSDSEKKVAKLYGANKGIFGSLVPARKTFLIDERGYIVAIINDVDINTHASEIFRLFNIHTP